MWYNFNRLLVIQGQAGQIGYDQVNFRIVPISETISFNFHDQAILASIHVETILKKARVSMGFFSKKNS